MGRSQREKGKRGEREWAKFLSERGLGAKRTGYHQVHKGSSEAADVEHDFFTAEVKRHKAFISKRVTDALSQALAHARKSNSIGYVAARNDGGEWHVVMHGNDFTELARSYTDQTMALHDVLLPKKAISLASKLSTRLDLSRTWFALFIGERKVSVTRFGANETMVTSTYYVDGVRMCAQHVHREPYTTFVRALIEAIEERKRVVGSMDRGTISLFGWTVQLQDGWWALADKNALASIRATNSGLAVSAKIWGTKYEAAGETHSADKLLDDIVMRVAEGSPEELTPLLVK